MRHFKLKFNRAHYRQHFTGYQQKYYYKNRPEKAIVVAMKDRSIPSSTS